MLWNLLHAAGLILLFGWSLKHAKSVETRRLSLVPLAMAVIELFIAGEYDPAALPAAAVVLAAMRLAVAGCCVAAVRRDAAASRNRARRRARLQRALREELAPVLREVPARRPAPARTSRCA